MMTALNDDVLRSTEGSRYATLVHGVLAPATGRLRYVNAGHPPSLVVAADGSWRTGLETTAPALGLFDGAAFPAADVILAPGDTLVVMSDGVCEALDPAGCELALSQVADAVAGCPDGAAAVAAAVVDRCGVTAAPIRTQDDVTVLSLRRTA